MKILIQKLKQFIRVVLGSEIYESVDVVCESEKYGSDYGGWAIIPTLIDERSIVYSFGVGEDISFDVDLINQFGLTVHAFDPTPRSISWVKRQNVPNKFTMHEIGLADFDGEVAFHPPANPKHVSHSILARSVTECPSITVPVNNLRTIMRNLGHETINILKMDIEGAEYSVIDFLCQSDIRPEQLLIEFHHRFESVGIEQTKNAIKTIREAGYQLFYISNNHLEYSFIYNRLSANN